MLVPVAVTLGVLIQFPTFMVNIQIRIIFVVFQSVVMYHSLSPLDTPPEVQHGRTKSGVWICPDVEFPTDDMGIGINVVPFFKLGDVHGFN